MYMRARSEARSKVDHAIQKAKGKVTQGLYKYPFGDAAENPLKFLTAPDLVPGFSAISFLEVRRLVAYAFIDAILERFHELRSDPTVRFYFFTACIDDGMTSFEAPIFRYGRIKRKIRQAWGKLGLQGVGAFEIDVLKNPLPGHTSRPLWLHVHGICWTRDPGFNAPAAEAALCQSISFPNRLGAPAVTIRSRKNAREAAERRLGSAQLVERYLRNKPHLDQTAASMAHLAYYMTKAPYQAKNLVRRPDRSPYLKNDEGGFNNRIALRFAEIYSHFSIAQILFDVGSDCSIAKKTRDHFFALRKERLVQASASTYKDICAAWAAYLPIHSRIKFVESQVVY